jgi:hypothetical protein
MRTFLMSFFIFLFLTTATTLAYHEWLDHQTLLAFKTAEPFELVTYSEVLTAPSGQRLVPMGAILGIHDVDVIAYTYSVPIEAGNSLEVTFSDVTLSKSGTMIFDTDEILDFSYEVETLDPNLAKVTVFVRMNMPTTETQYLRLQGSTVAFKVAFIQKPIL